MRKIQPSKAVYRAVLQAVRPRDVPQAQPVPPPVPTKICRNDPCPCGSGKKFKRCHLGSTHVVIGSNAPKPGV